MSLWRKKLVLHSNLAGVSNGHMQKPIMPCPVRTLPSSSSSSSLPALRFGPFLERQRLREAQVSGMRGVLRHRASGRKQVKRAKRGKGVGSLVVGIQRFRRRSVNQ
ncbi:hypothetical protein CRG98_030154 [Punica granatum]|uniref:Uncharacterized protein n=1 Tax=Punica granatum TaxID=22663 RepID=A0A2I0IZP8_PUNGR|nr:hypothetical protein CRG98_030154 [Punica granatum]